MKSALRLLTLAFFFHAASAWTMPMDFQFSFNDTANGTEVTGLIQGLLDDTANQQASSLFVLTSTGGWGIGEYVGDPAPTANSFSVAAGVIVGYSFYSQGWINDAPAVLCCDLVMLDAESGFGSIYALTEDTGSGSQIAFSNGEVNFQAVDASVPMPATIALLGLGLAGLGWSQRKKA